MPPLPDAPKVVKIEYLFKIDEDLFAKTRHFYQYGGTAPTPTQMAAFAASVNSSFNTNLKQRLTTAWQLSRVDCTDLSSPTSAFGSDATVRVGTEAGTGNIASACVVLSRKIARRFRGGHSRMYWPLGNQGDLQDAQTWKAASVTAFSTAFSNHFTAIAAAGWASAGAIAPVALSYYTGFTVFTGVTGRARNVSTVRAAPIIDTVLSVFVNTGVGSQRNRLLHLASRRVTGAR